MAALVSRVVVMVQENHTTDNYFAGLTPFGANLATGWPTQPNPPSKDQPRNRRAYFDWLTNGVATHTQFDTTAVIPYYLWLAIHGAFLENHCSGDGTNSTPNHLLIIGGQTPTLRNPPRAQPQPSGTCLRCPDWPRTTASAGAVTRVGATIRSPFTLSSTNQNS